MPVESWIMIALQSIYIISYNVIELWKIKKMQETPIEKPKQTEGTLSKTASKARKTFLSKLHLPLTMPLIVYAIVIAHNFDSNGVNIYTGKFAASIAIIAIFHVLFYILWQIIITIIRGHNDVLGHVLSRLQCHESIIFQLEGKPCDKTGECPFENKT